MSRSVQFAGLLILASATAVFGDQPADARPPVIRPVLPKKSGLRTMGPRLTNPGNPASRLYRASPEERDRALEKLPLRQQERIRKNLAWYDALAKPDQAIVLKRAERYESMSPEARRPSTSSSAHSASFRPTAARQWAPLCAACSRCPTASGPASWPAPHSAAASRKKNRSSSPTSPKSSRLQCSGTWRVRDHPIVCAITGIWYCFRQESLIILLNHSGASVRNQVSFGTEGT